MKSQLTGVLFLLLHPCSIFGQDSPRYQPALPTGSLQRIAFGSCAKHWQPHPFWKTILNTKPDLFLFIGDAVYADTDGKTAWDVTEKQLQGEWNRLADKPEFQRFRQRIPILATWDNHDYGTHNGGAEFALKKISKRIFLDFFGESEQSDRRKRDGIYDAKILGSPNQQVQIILLDTRSFKGQFKKDMRSKEEKQRLNIIGKYAPNLDPDATLLGREQWKWLEEQLSKKADVRLVVSSTQVIPDEKGMDEWGNYPLERKRLFELFTKTKANRVILLSGNVHFAEVSRMKTISHPIVEFTSSGLTHFEERYAKAANSYRVAGPYAGTNFGLVEIDWSRSTPAIEFTAFGTNGSIAFRYRHRWK